MIVVREREGKAGKLVVLCMGKRGKVGKVDDLRTLCREGRGKRCYVFMIPVATNWKISIQGWMMLLLEVNLMCSSYAFRKGDTRE